MGLDVELQVASGRNLPVGGDQSVDRTACADRHCEGLSMFEWEAERRRGIAEGSQASGEGFELKPFLHCKSYGLTSLKLPEVVALNCTQLAQRRGAAEELRMAERRRLTLTPGLQTENERGTEYWKKVLVVGVVHRRVKALGRSDMQGLFDTRELAD